MQDDGTGKVKRKHSARQGGKPTPRIRIGARSEQGETLFFVSDNGMGIDPRYHQRVFELFDKLDPRAEGTGVGLALVKRIIELHGGRVVVVHRHLREIALVQPHAFAIFDVDRWNYLHGFVCSLLPCAGEASRHHT